LALIVHDNKNSLKTAGISLSERREYMPYSIRMTWGSVCVYIKGGKYPG